MPLPAKLPGKSMAEDGFVRFTNEATQWHEVWMDANRTFKDYHNCSMKKTRAAETRLHVLTRMLGIGSERVRAIHIPWVHVVALDRSK
jgi:hypothetical protein